MMSNLINLSVFLLHKPVAFSSTLTYGWVIVIYAYLVPILFHL